MSNTLPGVGLFAIVIAGVAVPASAANIVVDPGFELGAPNSYAGAMGDGWVVTGGTGAICNAVTRAGCGNAGPANTGNQMAFLDWSTTFNTTTQTLTTVPGQTYAISYWVDDTWANLLQVNFGASQIFNGTAPTNGDYVQYIFNATATSSSTVLAFSGQRSTGRGGTLLDDVSVTPVDSLQGGPSSSPVFLVGSSAGGVAGTIGGFGSQEYYSFIWSGGAFNATAGITGANAGASYLFSEGLAGACSSGATQTLDGTDNFTGAIAISNLPAGQYCIGISANDPSDPTFTLVFNTPVSGAPEPSGDVLLSVGLGAFGALRLKKNLNRKDS